MKLGAPSDKIRQKVDPAFPHAVEVDTAGRTVVAHCERAQAEFGRDQIHAYGADPRGDRAGGNGQLNTAS